MNHQERCSRLGFGLPKAIRQPKTDGPNSGIPPYAPSTGSAPGKLPHEFHPVQAFQLLIDFVKIFHKAARIVVQQIHNSLNLLRGQIADPEGGVLISVQILRRRHRYLVAEGLELKVPFHMEGDSPRR